MGTSGCTATRAAVGVATAALLACGDESPPPVEPPPRPVVASAAVVPGAHNVLSAIVTASFLHADSAGVRFGPAGGPLDDTTPRLVVGPVPIELPVLGLQASTAYALQVVAYGEGGETAGDTLRLTTGALPADLPAYSAGGANPSPGYVVFGAYPYGLVIDNAGRVVWYRHLDQGPTLNFQVQQTGRYTTSPVTPTAGDPTPWVEFDSLGNETRRLGCVAGLTSRFHELVAELDGSYWMFCDDVRVMDLTPYGGLPAATVSGTAVQHVGPGGQLLFAWTPFDHFAITDLDSASRTGPAVNWTHGNAMDFDADGNLVVSFRSLNEITKIDVHSGAVLWRMGGLANQFTFAGTTPFVGQHGLRVVGLGGLLLFDNRGQVGDSRAERYQVDAATHNVQLAGNYAALPAVSSILGGSTQLLPGGHVLVAYGNGNRVQEYDASGAVVWEIHGNPGYVFRAQRIPSLYRPIPWAPPRMPVP